MFQRGRVKEGGRERERERERLLKRNKMTDRGRERVNRVCA